MKPTKEEVKAGIAIIGALAEAVRELGEVPSGHLYANVMGKLSYNNYQAAISTLERAKLIKVEPSHLIRWIGPEVPK